MNLFFLVVLTFSISLTKCENEQQNTENALMECSNIHRLQFKHIPNAHAHYFNSNCLLRCSVGNETLSTDAMNEGFGCPLNSDGVCHNGVCVDNAHAKHQNAVRECGNVHHIDFVTQHNDGTAFSDSKCFLKCVLNGNVISAGAINEGFHCPENQNGICRNGRCAVESSQSPTVQPTTVSVFTEPSIDQIDQIQIQIESANFTKSLNMPQAVACIEQLASNSSYCKSNNWRSHCTTHVILHTDQNPHWNHLCYMHGPFTQRESILVSVFHDDGRHEAGRFTRNLTTLFSEHYRSKHFPNVPVSFRIEHQLELVHAETVTGWMNVSFLYQMIPK